MDFSEAFHAWLQTVVILPLPWPAMPTKGKSWEEIGKVDSAAWVCGHCNNHVASNEGWHGWVDGTFHMFIRVCHLCGAPTFFPAKGGYLPQARFGSTVSSLPEDVRRLYDEARDCAAAGANTACILCCRKILLHVAVEREADASKTFVQCIEWLHSKGYIPPGGKGWVDYIRTKGNEANHEIVLMERKDAELVLTLTEHLLRNVYELPSLMPEQQ